MKFPPFYPSKQPMPLPPLKAATCNHWSSTMKPSTHYQNPQLRKAPIPTTTLHTTKKREKRSVGSSNSNRAVPRRNQSPIAKTPSSRSSSRQKSAQSSLKSFSCGRKSLFIGQRSTVLARRSFRCKASVRSRRRRCSNSAIDYYVCTSFLPKLFIF
jgi:hypothetical protein